MWCLSFVIDVNMVWNLQEIEPRVAEELCRLFPKDEGINLTPVLHKSKRASRVARARGPLRRPLQSPGDRRGRPRERGSFRGRGDVGFRCVTSTRVESRKGEACILLKLSLVPTSVKLQQTPQLEQQTLLPLTTLFLHFYPMFAYQEIFTSDTNTKSYFFKLNLIHTNFLIQNTTEKLLANPGWGCFAEVHNAKQEFLV